MTASGIALSAGDVARTYRDARGAEVRAVAGVSFVVAPGSWVALTGPSGCGKSTLLALVGLLDRPDAGRVLHDGADAGALSASARAMARRRIGFVFQSAASLARLAVHEDVAQPLVPWGVPSRERRARADAALDAVGLLDLGDRRTEELSGGERQRAALARAMVVAPRLLIADEPTSQLDPESARRVLDGIAAARRGGTTVLVASHDPAVLACADVVVRMAAGRVVS